MEVFTGLGVEGDANGELAEKVTLSIVTTVYPFTNTISVFHIL